MEPKEFALMNSPPNPEEEGTPPIIDISEEMRQSEKTEQEREDILYSTAEFLIISISGCAPKKVME